METRKTPLVLTASALALALMLVGCGGGSSGSPQASSDTAALPAPTPPPDPDPAPPTPYESAETGIAAATTPEAAQKAYDDVKDNVTAAEGDKLQAAVDARIAALAKADRAEDQKMALTDAGINTDDLDLTTQDGVDDARDAIVALRSALDDAADLSDADKAMYQTQLDAAIAAVDGAQDGLDTAMRRTDQMADLSAASTALATALTAITGKTPTEDELNAAKAAKTGLDMALSDAMDLTDAEKAEYVRQAANAEGPIAAADAAYAAAEQKRMDAEKRAAEVAQNKVSMKVAEAINAHTVAGDPPAEFLVDADGNPNTTNMDLKFTRGSSEAKITPYQNTADKKLKPFTTGTAQDAGTGWSGMTFTRSGTAAKKAFTEVGTVYTDIEQAKAQLWATAFATGFSLVSGSGQVTIATTASLDAMHFTGILPSAPASGESTTVTIDADDHVPGSFYGVSGDFECGGTNCVVTRNSAGKVSVSGTLTFTPDEYDVETTMAAYANDDDDYTHFGYWTKKTKQRDGSYTHDIETFFGGMGDLTPTLSTVTGTAKYYGAAAGVYVKKDGADDTLVVTDGNFTADAMLTADFGGDKIAVDNQHMIRGTISGFMDGGMDLGFADLTLEKADFAPSGTVIATFMGETNGGGTSGNWSGQFYGNAGSATTTGPSPAADDFPRNVSGEFNGHFVNGHVAGAFGAEKD